MKLTTLILPSLALGAAALLVSPPESHGFSTIGGSLSQSQRDFRTFTNWTDPDADDSTVTDPQFPGHVGTVMAIWKACIEWGNVHGNGSGDPLQSTLGSGGANFDPSFQQEATGIGGTNDNIHSQISGGAGGVLAFTETPISNGWRIRYYENWAWEDGPGAPSFFEIDIQGVATHEYGHALGLGHTLVGGATMYPSISGTGTVTRSIEQDDINGVRFIYGTASASKPSITGVSLSGSQVTITGTNFSATNNQVWFTNANITATGVQPIVKVLNVTASGGQITVTLPSNAGPGDVQVRNNGTGHSNLSNATPFDAGGVGPGLTITNISPSSVQAVNPGTTHLVTITGTGFDPSALVFVDGVQLVGFPFPWSVVDGQTITFDPSVVSKLGSVEVKVQIGGSSAASSITYVENDPPALMCGLNGENPVSVNTLQGFDVVMGGKVGETFFLLASFSNIPSDVPGLFSLELGNGLTQIFHIGTFITPAATGYSSAHYPVSLPAGTTFYMEGLSWDLVSFPVPDTNLQEMLVLF